MALKNLDEFRCCRYCDVPKPRPALTGTLGNPWAEAREAASMQPSDLPADQRSARLWDWGPTHSMKSRSTPLLLF